VVSGEWLDEGEVSLVSDGRRRSGRKAGPEVAASHLDLGGVYARVGSFVMCWTCWIAHYYFTGFCGMRSCPIDWRALPLVSGICRSCDASR
jgi:hypothetical protein